MEDIDLIITVLFMVEAAMKIIVYGFIINGNDSYLNSIGNILDFSVIIFSAISLD
jgi:hypothetical protein